MKSGKLAKHLLIGVSACGALLAASRAANAEITLYDKDNWSVKTDGLAQGFYMFATGDAKPVDNRAADVVTFDFLGTYDANADGKFVASRFRSGWTGGRFNWRITNQLSERTKVSAYLGIAYSISTQNGPANTNNKWDIRNGYLDIEGPWGDFIVGRHVGLYTLGSIISTINMTSAALGLGNTCGVGGDGLSCYTSGYGVKFPGFWAGMVYTTPDLAGLKIKVAAFDPVAVGADMMGPGGTPVSQAWHKTPTPHFQTLAMYELAFGRVKLKPFFNGFAQQIGRTEGNTDKTLTPYGVGGGLDVFLGSMFKLGAGGSSEQGTNLYVPLVGNETVDGAGNLRHGASIYVQGMLTLGNLDLSAGFGQATLDRTTFDQNNNLNINRLQRNVHGALQYHVGPLTWVAEVNVLHHEYHAGSTQDMTVVSLGADFAY